jgi:hypothetical protein
MTWIWVGIALVFFIGVSVIGYAFVLRNKSEKKKETYHATTQDHLPFEYIRGNIVKLKTGKYILLIKLPSLNIELMEGEEREMVMEQYRQILTSFNFPFQYHQQSRIVDVSEYLSHIEERISLETNPLLIQYLNSYADLIENEVRDRSILTKGFYFVLPFKEEKNQTKNQNVREEEEQLEKAKKQLISRGEIVVRSFRRLGVSPHILDDRELLDLYYTAYNKDRAVTQSLHNQGMEELGSIRVKAKRRGKNEI